MSHEHWTPTKTSLSAPRTRLRLWAVAVLVIVLLAALQTLPGMPRVFPDLGSYGNSFTIFLLLFFSALLCEFVDSSLGMGYGTTLAPILLLAGFDPIEIVPAVLLSELATGALAALFHQRDGNVDFLRDRAARQTVLTLGTLSALGAIAAVFVALSIPQVWVTLIIGIVVLSVGITIIVSAGRTFAYRTRNIVVLGTIAAFNKGLSGGGYGPLVTAGQIVSGVGAKQAIAISSLTEAITCFIGLMTYLVLSETISFVVAVPLTLGAMCSVPLATLTVRSLPERAMRYSVGIMTVVLGALSLVKVFAR